jgi:hypothetical protein
MYPELELDIRLIMPSLKWQVRLPAEIYRQRELISSNAHVTNVPDQLNFLRKELGRSLSARIADSTRSFFNLWPREPRRLL